MTSQNRLDQLRDLRDQWEQLVGYQFEIPDWAIQEMAGDPGRYQTLYDVGQYMQAHAGYGSGAFLWTPDRSAAMPWAKYGMSATAYATRVEGYDSTFRTLTGQAAPIDLVDTALREHEGTMTAAQFSTWLMAQDNIKNTYGWLRYGLDFQQFQTQKLQMRSSFGRDLTDQEAVTQLQYLHAAAGSNAGASVQPTFSQQEKKSAQVGVEGSVVR
jgi:hypothetical protein